MNYTKGPMRIVAAETPDGKPLYNVYPEREGDRRLFSVVFTKAEDAILFALAGEIYELMREKYGKPVD